MAMAQPPIAVSLRVGQQVVRALGGEQHKCRLVGGVRRPINRAGQHLQVAASANTAAVAAEIDLAQRLDQIGHGGWRLAELVVREDAVLPQIDPAVLPALVWGGEEVGWPSGVRGNGGGGQVGQEGGDRGETGGDSSSWLPLVELHALTLWIWRTGSTIVLIGTHGPC